MNVLIVGSGGREHALAWKLRQSPMVERLYVAPGNAGTATLAENLPVPADDLTGLLEAARERRVGLTVVGPEAPLAAGIVDRFEAAGLRIFGPAQQAARIEADKVFAKDLMARHGIPTAAYGSFDRYAAALAYARRSRYPLVVKAAGLAAGKGVVVCHEPAEAEAALRRAMVEGEFGAAGARVVIEAFLSGAEASVFALCDGRNIRPLLVAQDHKALLEGDRGPNTGGMGAYAPARLVDDALLQRIVATILRPAVDALRAEGAPYRGVLFAGLMLTPQGPQVLEFNARLGDPEAQAILPLLKDDLLPLLEACLADAGASLANAPPLGRTRGVTGEGPAAPLGRTRGVTGEGPAAPLGRTRGVTREGPAAPLGRTRGVTREGPAAPLGVRPLRWSPRSCLCVVAASGGYPGPYRSGLPIAGLDAAAALPDTMVFHAGTRATAGQVLTAGGRVLGVTALGDTLAQAAAQALAAMGLIHFEGLHYRRDIGAKAAERDS